jgi:hypothetical protein
MYLVTVNYAMTQVMALGYACLDDVRSFFGVLVMAQQSCVVGF